MADLIVLINEAAPALLARPLLYYLAENNIEYSDPSGKTPFPLLLYHNFQGDVDTKFAFPGGQFLDHNKPKFKTYPPDRFGIDSDKTYFYLTTANTIALQNHQFVSRAASAEKQADGAFVSPRVGHTAYDLVPKPGNNRTPYWVTQLPQVFVPDHGTVFGVEFMRLLVELLDAPQDRYQAAGAGEGRRLLLPGGRRRRAQGRASACARLFRHATRPGDGAQAEEGETVIPSCGSPRPLPDGRGSVQAADSTEPRASASGQTLYANFRNLAQPQPSLTRD